MCCLITDFYNGLCAPRFFQPTCSRPTLLSFCGVSFCDDGLAGDNDTESKDGK